ncbi:hypothetical protein GOODEAATRI_019013 [Goodea atripinnis]|uniref:Uncharacterized protein n=1 Tax=Goodea atripinnis TaxID=208336 RepID=A0ABV0NLG3_9TELE
MFISTSFWDWEKGERLDYFYNGNPRYTRITAMEYLNGHDCSLLLTATDDGALRVWKNFADQKNPEMVTAWQGLSDMLPTTRGQPSSSTHSKDQHFILLRVLPVSHSPVVSVDTHPHPCSPTCPSHASTPPHPQQV